MENKNVYTLMEKITDANGKTHKIYPCPILELEEVAQFLAKVNPDFIFGSFMVAESDADGCLERDDNGKLIYGRTMREELLDVIEIALRHKEKREDIAKWLDIGISQQIIECLIGMSQVKKKTAAVIPM